MWDAVDAGPGRPGLRFLKKKKKKKGENSINDYFKCAPMPSFLFFFYLKTLKHKMIKKRNVPSLESNDTEITPPQLGWHWSLIVAV